MAQTIVKMIFGSHLYGTATEHSDRDIKGVFMPERDAILLQRVPKTQTRNVVSKMEDGKNAPDAVDEDLYSLHNYIELACKGETVAIDMLHAPDWAIEQSSPIWDELRAMRSAFYTSKLSAFVGYARKQAAKYGVKGSRLATVRALLVTLRAHSETARLGEVWTFGANDHGWEHIHELAACADTNHQRQLQVCGKRFGEKTPLREIIKSLDHFEQEFGNRARLAERNEGVDWKAVSHALRAAYQLLHIYRDGDIHFPLPEAELLRSVKQGRLHYAKEVAPMLDNLIDEVERSARESSLPANVNRKEIDQWLLQKINESITA